VTKFVSACDHFLTKKNDEMSIRMLTRFSRMWIGNQWNNWCKISKDNTLFMICHNLSLRNLSLSYLAAIKASYLSYYHYNRHVLVISPLMSTIIDAFYLSPFTWKKRVIWRKDRRGVVGIWSGWVDMARQRQWRISAGIWSALRIFYERANTLIFDFDSFCACV
jgi:hypothetical protein